MTAGAEARWKPCAAPAALRRRAQLLGSVRRFFEERGVLEVETPVLSRAATTDPHLRSLATRVEGLGRAYLQTSPELPMKRLLLAKRRLPSFRRQSASAASITCVLVLSSKGLGQL